jgi:hypothetical protein
MHNEVPRQGRYHILYGAVPWPLLTCQGECETASLGTLAGALDQRTAGARCAL